MSAPIVAVFDTNILIRLALKRTKAIDRLWTALRAQMFDLILSATILTELERVLNYPRLQKRYGLNSEKIAAFVKEIQEIAILTLELYEIARVEQDPTDDVFLACALEAYADYLVTEDNHLRAIKYYQGVQIIGLEQFQKVIGL
jgi:uncharacterized protein